MVSESRLSAALAPDCKILMFGCWAPTKAIPGSSKIPTLGMYDHTLERGVRPSLSLRSVYLLTFVAVLVSTAPLLVEMPGLHMGFQQV